MSEGKRSKKTCSKPLRVVASHSGAAVGLPPPGEALTSMPEALRGRRAGAIRIKKSESPYAARSERRGDLRAVVAGLLEVRRRTQRGESLVGIVADGTPEGWRLREALTNAAGAPLLRWDGEQYRTQADRLALVERTLDLYGYVRPRRGGWSVGGR